MLSMNPESQFTYFRNISVQFTMRLRNTLRCINLPQIAVFRHLTNSEATLFIFLSIAFWMRGLHTFVIH